MITNDDRLNWLVKRISYMEHDDAQGVPAIEQGLNDGVFPPPEDSEFVDLSLIEYIDCMIKKELK